MGPMRRISRFDVYLCEAALACFAVFGLGICGIYIFADAAQRAIHWRYTDVSLGSFLGNLVAYYVVGLPGLAAGLTPICWMVAVIVVVFFLQKRNEIMAFNVHGVSVYRVLAPLVALSVVLCGLILLCNEGVAPLLGPMVQRHEQAVGWRGRGDRTIVQVGDGRSFYWLNSVDMGRHRVDGVVLISYDARGGPKDVVWAREGEWRGSALWLSDVWLPRSAFHEERRKAEHLDQLAAPAPLTPETILAAATPTEMGSAGSVRALMESMPGNRFFQMAYYDHFVSPLAPLIFALLAIPMVVGNEFAEGGSARGILICLLLCAGYYAVKSICHNIGATGNLAPLHAAWLPVVLFAAIGLYLFSSIRT